MKYRNIMFDLDGTLQDPQGFFAVMHLVLKDMGLPEVPYTTLCRSAGPPMADIFAGLLNVPDERIEEAVKRYAAMSEETGLETNLNHPYPGIVEMLERLQKAGKRLYVVTARPQERAEKVVRGVGFMKYLEGVFAAKNDDFADKAQQLNKIFDSTDCTRDNSVMVGDRKYDIAGAIGAGIDSVGVTYGSGTVEELTEAGATHIVNSVSELEAILME